MWSIRGWMYPENRNQIKFWGLKNRKITDCYVVCNGLQGGICSFVIINEFKCGYNVINSESLQLVGYRFPESLSLIVDTFLCWHLVTLYELFCVYFWVLWWWWWLFHISVATSFSLSFTSWHGSDTFVFYSRCHLTKLTMEWHYSELNEMLFFLGTVYVMHSYRICSKMNKFSKPE